LEVRAWKMKTQMMTMTEMVQTMIRRDKKRVLINKRDRRSSHWRPDGLQIAMRSLKIKYSNIS
jgi:hypothetical protein